MAVRRVTTRDARFQHWQTLLTNRTKRHRSGEFVVQGVRPITLAVEHGWPVRTWLHADGGPHSDWARARIEDVPADRVALPDAMLAELGQKSDDAPELLAVVAMPPDSLSRLPVGPSFLGVVFDRPTSPGNLGTLARSIDAFGGHGLVVTGHAADPYDPKAIRASTGSLLAVPSVRVDAARDVVDWLGAIEDRDRRPSIVGTDEDGERDVVEHDLTRPTLLVVGNETTGMSAAWRAACDHVVRVPMVGSASSLNAASAATVVLYEAARQRASVGPGA